MYLVLYHSMSEEMKYFEKNKEKKEDRKCWQWFINDKLSDTI